MNNEFHYMYPAGQFSNTPMGAPIPDTTGLISMPGNPQQQSMMHQYTYAPPFNKASPVPLPSMNYSTRIIGDYNSIVYYHDGQNSTLNEFKVCQMVTSDGVVFVEHKPGYSLVYVSNSEPIDQVLGTIPKSTPMVQKTSGKGIKLGKTPRDPLNHVPKPSNKFILYRKSISEELKKKNPGISQTEISCAARDLWNKESDEVKEKFKKEYHRQKQEYDTAKNAGKRPSSSMLSQANTDEDVLSSTSKKCSKSSIPSNFGSSARNFDVSAVSSNTVPLPTTGNIDVSPTSSIHGGSNLVQGNGQPPSATSMSISEQNAIYANQHAAMAAGIDPTTFESSENAVLASSFINPEIAASISNICNPQGLPISTNVDNIDTTASIVTSTIMAGSFYNRITPPAEQPAGWQWDQTVEYPPITEVNELMYSRPATTTPDFSSQ